MSSFRPSFLSVDTKAPPDVKILLAWIMNKFSIELVCMSHVHSTVGVDDRGCGTVEGILVTVLKPARYEALINPNPHVSALRQY